MQDEQKAFGVNQVAKQLGVSRDSVLRAISKGKLRAIRFGKRILISKAELDRLLEAR